MKKVPNSDDAPVLASFGTTIAETYHIIAITIESFVSFIVK